MLRSTKKNRATKASQSKSNSKKTAPGAAPTQTPEPRKRISTVTPSPPGPSIARASVIDDPSSLQLDNDDDSTLPEDLFTVDQAQDTSEQDAIAETVCEEVDAIIATEVVDMSPANKGNATTTISKSELDALVSEKKGLNDELGVQLENVRKLKADLKTAKDQLVDILTTSKDDYALDLQEKYNTLKTQHEEYVKKTEASLKEFEELKSKKKATGLDDKEVESLQKRSEELTKTKAALTKTKNALEKTKAALETTKCSVKTAMGQNKSLTAAIDQLKKDLAKAKQDLKASKKEVASLEKKLENSVQDDEDSDNDEDEDGDSHSKAYYKKKLSEAKALMKKNDEEYNALVDKYDRVKDRLEQCYEVLNAKNKSIPAEESQDIRNVARAFLKDVLFRTFRLTNSSNPAQVKTLIKKVYDGIKKEMGFETEGDDKLEFKEFHRIYQKKLMEYYSGLRSNVQSACKAAIMGKFFSTTSRNCLCHNRKCNLQFSNVTFASTEWYKDHGYVPTAEQMKNVYNIPPKDI